jgi:hypothetical protein
MAYSQDLKGDNSERSSSLFFAVTSCLLRSPHELARTACRLLLLPSVPPHYTERSSTSTILATASHPTPGPRQPSPNARGLLSLKDQHEFDKKMAKVERKSLKVQQKRDECFIKDQAKLEKRTLKLERKYGCVVR